MTPKRSRCFVVGCNNDHCSSHLLSSSERLKRITFGFEGNVPSHLTAKAVVCRELPKHQRDLIVEMYQSGEGYKIISKALDIPWNTVKPFIIKWRKYGATVTLPSTGYPSKMYEKMRRKLVREAAMRPKATLKELQEILASTSCVVYVTTISQILHISGLWGRLEIKTPKSG